ncbi:S9 family peptidase [Mariniblastus sp.]|nr:S9 family peptidase [Mariniblastus sp.]
MLILLCLLVVSSVASFNDSPEQPKSKQDHPPSANPKMNQDSKQKSITLSMIDGPERILADLPTAPKWFRDKNWLVVQQGDSRSLQDAATGDPVVDQATTSFTADDLKAAIEKQKREKANQDNSNQEDDPETEQPAVSPRLQQLLADLGDAAEQSSLFTFNHDASKLAYVSDKGFHVFELASKQTKTLPAESKNHLVGKLDWVYQEELYGRGNFKGFWWQPDGDQIAFLELDESPLTPFVVMDHLPVLGKSEVTNYPKAGDSNPLVRVGVTSASHPSKVKWVDLSAYADEQIVVSAVTWSQDGTQLMLQVQNRGQTWLDLIATDASGGNARVLFRDSTPAWIESPGDPILLNNGDFIWRSPRSGYSHLYRYNKDGKLVKAITEGEWEIRSLLGVDEKNEFVYFTATKDSPLEVHGYRVRLADGQISRLTELGNFHSLDFNDEFSMFVDESSTVSTAPKYALRNADGSLVRTFFEDQVDPVAELNLPAPEFLEIKNPRNDQPMDMALFRPADFDETKKYPLLVHIYAGPQAPKVLNRFRGTDYLWHQMLAQQGYLVLLCDNQSASYRSVKNAWPIHRNLATNELADIETCVDQIKKNSWVDDQRIGIWGWSYGGYMTAFALTHSKTFKMGISGAPVTDWTNYDSIYTERYMGTPQTNEAGYNSSSVLHDQAKNLHGELLLIHGTIDDNVHLNNSLQFMQQLQEAGKQFEVMFYPSNRHSVTDQKQRVHLRKLMTDFVLENL